MPTQDDCQTADSLRKTATVCVDEARKAQLAEAGQNLPLDWLADAAGLARSEVKRAMKAGALWLAKAASGPGAKPGKPRRIRRLGGKLAVGDELTLYYDPEVLAQRCPDAVLLEDCGEYSVWDKPAGMLCQGSRWGDHTTLQRWAEQQLGHPCQSVHRLDKMTSGVMLLAHSQKAARRLADCFARRSVRKTYQCLVAEPPALDLPFEIDQPLDAKPAKTTLISSVNTSQWLNTPAKYSNKDRKSIEIPANVALLTVLIETGRFHQVRRHLETLGHPILGDRRYSSADFDPVLAPDLQLRSVALEFYCPFSEQDKAWKVS